MPESVLIQYDTCRMTLNLPAFFAVSPMGNIRKVFKLLSERPYQNETAFQTLDQFFPAWAESLKADQKRAVEEKKAAEQAARAAESKVACFGTMATEEMKAELKKAEQTAKKAATAAKHTKSALERYEKIINAYKEILR